MSAPCLSKCRSAVAIRAGVGQRREALDQLHLRYLHVRAGKTGVLDYTFERYLLEGERAGMSFLEWVESPLYDPDAMKADFRAGKLGGFLTESLL